MRYPKRRTSLRRRVRKALSAAGNLAALPVARAWPRSGRQWVFGHEGNTFAGNPKYLFLWLCLHRPDLQPTWITGSRVTYDMLATAGYRVARRWSPRGMLAALRAGAFFFSHDVADVNAPLSWGAIKLNLWHGVGLKALQVSRQRGTGFGGKLRDMMSVPHDRVISTSDLMQTHFAAQFELSASRCPQLGYPRLDAAFDAQLAKTARSIEWGSGFEGCIAGYDEIYVYMPTFRDSGRPFFERALPDLAMLSTSLAERNALLLIKPHPRTGLELTRLPGNIALWPDRADFYANMTAIDILITDYSSVLYDFIYAGRGGIILYTFDLSEYLATDRELVASFHDNTVGYQVDSFGALCGVLCTGAALDRSKLQGLPSIRRRFWGGAPKLSSPAIAGYVASLAATRRASGRRSDPGLHGRPD